MPPRLGALSLTASALANASQACPIPALQTVLRLAALCVEVVSVRVSLEAVTQM